MTVKSASTGAEVAFRGRPLSREIGWTPYFVRHSPLHRSLRFAAWRAVGPLAGTLAGRLWCCTIHPDAVKTWYAVRATSDPPLPRRQNDPTPSGCAPACVSSFFDLRFALDARPRSGGSDVAWRPSDGVPRDRCSSPWAANLPGLALGGPSSRSRCQASR